MHTRSPFASFAFFGLQAACLLCCSPLCADVISSTFDAGAEGWTISSNGASTTPDFMISGGNPGGMIQDTDAQSGVAWFFDAPVAFLGDQSRHFDHSLSYDIRHTGSGSLFDATDIRLVGGGITLLQNFATLPNPGDWTTFSTFLNGSSGWQVSGGGAATNADLQTALANVTALQIRGEYLSGAIGGDTGRLDNVILGANTAAVPEPGTFAVAGLMGGLLLWRKRRRFLAAESVPESI